MILVCFVNTERFEPTVVNATVPDVHISGRARQTWIQDNSQQLQTFATYKNTGFVGGFLSSSMNPKLLNAVWLLVLPAVFDAEVSHTSVLKVGLPSFQFNVFHRGAFGGTAAHWCLQVLRIINRLQMWNHVERWIMKLTRHKWYPVRSTQIYCCSVVVRALFNNLRGFTILPRIRSW